MSVGPPSDRTAVARIAVQRLLRLGLALSLVLLAVATVWGLVSPSVAAPVRLRHLLDDGRAPDRVAALGLVVLTLTPFARVVALIVEWWRERDWRFVLTGCTVVLVLVASLLAGHA